MKLGRSHLKGRIAAATAAAAVLGGTLVLAVPGIAQAQTQYQCGTFGASYAGQAGQAWAAYNMQGWVKQPPGCHDLNLVYSNNPNDNNGIVPGDSYGAYYHGWAAGWYGWHWTAEGWQLGRNGVHDPSIVLLYTVMTGTKLAVVGYNSPYEDAVHVNY